MPDLSDDLAAMLRARAGDAPAAPAPPASLVRSVRRRRRLRVAAATGGCVTGVAATLVAVAAVAGPAPRVVSPAAPASPTPSPPADDRYEFCTAPPTPLVEVRTFATELKYDRGCYVAVAGAPVRLSFTNTTKVAHNVVVAPEGGEAFAKTETVRVSGTAKAGYDTVDLGVLERGDYTLTCDVHPGMRAQLIAR